MSAEAFARTLSILGPIVVAVGSGMLVLDVIEQPVRWYRLVWHPTGLKRLDDKLYRRELARLERLSPPYSKEDVEAMRAELEERNRERQKETEDRRDELDLEYRVHGRKRAAVGFGLIVVGSVSQALGALLG